MIRINKIMNWYWADLGDTCRSTLLPKGWYNQLRYIYDNMGLVNYSGERVEQYKSVLNERSKVLS